MLKKIIAPLSLLCLPLLLLAQPKIQLVNFASGFNRPVDIAHCNDSRLFVVEQDGAIKVVDSLGNVLPVPFLDINPIVNSTGNEQGLLGLAFHPDYAQNGYFFVYYTQNSGGSTHVSRFSVMPDNPNKADPTSELTILLQAQPYSNHNGGSIKFGPDGYLYIGLGDGGSGGDPQGNGQKKNTFLGKILRIDVNNASVNSPYVVPSDNPFVGDAAYLPEIWALGVRNPWRFSFDRLTGDMWIGEVGQGDREEIDFAPAGVGGRNYGWRCYEGNLPYNTSGCQGASSYIGPVFDYDNSSLGCSVTGGFVYRGTKYPDLYGYYLFSDYCSGRWWATRQMENGSFNTILLGNLSDYEYTAYGEDRDGELYVTLLSSGKIQKIKEICSPFQVVPSSINSPVCDGTLSGWVFLDTIGTTGNVSFIWSNGRDEKDIVYLNPGTYTVIVTNGNGCSRVQTYEIENASPPAPLLLSGDLVLCGGDSIQLATSEAPAEYGYQWFNNQFPILNATDQSLNVTEPGAYTVQLITQGAGCNSLTSAEANVIMDVSLEPQVGLEGDSLYALTPCENGCQWLFNNEPIPDATGSYHIATQSGIYELEVITQNGCQRQSGGVSVIVSDAVTPASVQSFTLSPNPADRSITLQMMLLKTERVTVILQDKQMRQISSQTLENQSITLPINLENLPAGTYYLHIQVGNERFVRKIVKI